MVTGACRSDAEASGGLDALKADVRALHHTLHSLTTTAAAASQPVPSAAAVHAVRLSPLASANPFCRIVYLPAPPASLSTIVCVNRQCESTLTLPLLTLSAHRVCVCAAARHGQAATHECGFECGHTAERRRGGRKCTAFHGGATRAGVRLGRCTHECAYGELTAHLPLTCSWDSIND